ncbi:MAG: uncharacterized membrane protein (DUF373 family) [Oceanicoccus sp.]|jgi:uncharacterized membrane protein (DUF373 family)
MEKIALQLLHYFERTIVVVLIITMVLGVTYATFVALGVIYENVMSGGFHGGSSDHSIVQTGLYRLYGSFLTILLGLELIHTVKVYFKDNYIKVESIFVISILALSRHIIQLHLETVQPFLLVGLAALMGVLIAGYIAMRRNIQSLK